MTQSVRTATPRWGMVQVFTGDGKGKTTAALGTAIRAAAKGKRVAIVAFDKGGEAHYSERTLVRERIPEIQYFVTGLDRIDPKTNLFRFGVTVEDKTEGERGLQIVRDLFEKHAHDLIILDELNSCISLGIVSEASALETLRAKPDDIELIITGRKAPDSLIEGADLVTEMRIVKHYFYQGEPAREGLDF